MRCPLGCRRKPCETGTSAGLPGGGDGLGFDLACTRPDTPAPGPPTGCGARSPVCWTGLDGAGAGPVGAGKGWPVSCGSNRVPALWGHLGPSLRPAGAAPALPLPVALSGVAPGSPARCRGHASRSEGVPIWLDQGSAGDDAGRGQRVSAGRGQAPGVVPGVACRSPVRSERVAISVEGFEAIARTLTLGSVSFENKTDEEGQRLIWLRPRWWIFYSLHRRRCYARHGVDRPASRHAGLRSLLPRPPQRSMQARPCSSQ